MALPCSSTFFRWFAPWKEQEQIICVQGMHPFTDQVKMVSLHTFSSVFYRRAGAELQSSIQLGTAKAADQVWASSNAGFLLQLPNFTIPSIIFSWNNPSFVGGEGCREEETRRSIVSKMKTRQKINLQSFLYTSLNHEGTVLLSLQLML